MKMYNKFMIGVWLLLIMGLFAFGTGVAEAAGDPNGSDTYSESIEGLKISINVVWTLIAAFLVFSMQAGFAFLGGFLRQKNMLNYLAHCFIDSTLGACVFYFFGFAVMFGGSQAYSGLDRGWPGIGWEALCF